MNVNKQKGKTPLQARQERLQHLKAIYEANKGKTLTELEKLLSDPLYLEGLTYRKIREYLNIVLEEEYAKADVMTLERLNSLQVT